MSFYTHIYRRNRYHINTQNISVTLKNSLMPLPILSGCRPSLALQQYRADTLMVPHKRNY